MELHEEPSISLSGNVMHLKGRFVFTKAEKLLFLGNKLLSKVTESLIVINMDEVSRLDSAGIALLLEWKKFANKNNKNILLGGLNKQTSSLIATYKLQNLFGIKD